MRQYHLVLEFRKETDNKLRWDAPVGDAAFELYIPKEHVPQPWPERVNVTIIPLREHGGLGCKGSETPNYIEAHIEPVEGKTKTVRYRPSGDPSLWRIGEPYVPKAILEVLSVSGTETLKLVVEWS
jgi:hypothetical protein